MGLRISGRDFSEWYSVDLDILVNISIGTPSTFPISRIAERIRYVENEHTRAACSFPYFLEICSISSFLISLGKSRSISGMVCMFSLRKRPRNRFDLTGSIWESPTR